MREVKYMKKFVPSIIIWNLELSDLEDGFVYQNLYFLSYRRADKFCKKNEEKLKEFRVSLGGERLWLW